MTWFIQICLGLNYIHSMNILHRDLKTSNIFLTSNNSTKIGDFGISKVLHEALDISGTVAGTPYYMSPEVCQRKPYTLKSDIWALGCILYELATFQVPNYNLQHPFLSDNLLTLVYSIMTEPYNPLPVRYSKDFNSLVESTLAKDDSKRPTTRNILDLPYVEKYMKNFIKEKEKESIEWGFQRQATAKVYMQEEQFNKAEPEKNIVDEEKVRLMKEKKAIEQFERKKTLMENE